MPGRARSDLARGTSGSLPFARCYRAGGASGGACEGAGGSVSVAVLSTNRPRLARRVRLEWDSVRERHVLLAPEGVLVLNKTGATIVGLCDGDRTVGGIVDELRGRYDRVADDEVRDFISRLLSRRWMELGDG